MGRRRHSFAPRESLIQGAVLEHWLVLRLPHTLVAAIPNAGAMGQPGLTCGLADLFVITPQIGVGFLELKRDERARTSDAQREFGRLCAALRIPHAIVTGRDEPIRVLEQWGAVRAQMRAA